MTMPRRRLIRPTPIPVLPNPQRQRLAFRFEAGDDLAAVHAGLDDLEGDLALDGFRLLGHPDDAHAAFADLLEQLVRTDDGARPFACESPAAGGIRIAAMDAALRLMGLQQQLDPFAQLRVVPTGFDQEVGPLLGRPFQGGKKNCSDIGFDRRHGGLTSDRVYRTVRRGLVNFLTARVPGRYFLVRSSADNQARA